MVITEISIVSLIDLQDVVTVGDLFLFRLECEVQVCEGRFELDSWGRLRIELEADVVTSGQLCQVH